MNWPRITSEKVTALVANTAPWLSPLPTAYLTTVSIEKHLAWAPWISVVSGAIVEFVGLAAVHTALELYSHNRKLPAEMPERRRWEAPFVLGAVLVGVYFFSVLGLTVLLDTWAEMARIAPVVFPVLSLAGFGVLGIRADQEQRVTEMILAKAGPYRAKRYDAWRARLIADETGETKGPEIAPVPANLAPLAPQVPPVAPQITAMPQVAAGPGGEIAANAPKLTKAEVADWADTLNGERKRLSAAMIAANFGARAGTVSERTLQLWAQGLREN